MIYLDYQATTPLAPQVAEAMRPWIEDKFANPHSPSRLGSEAAAAVEEFDDARRILALHAGSNRSSARESDAAFETAVEVSGRDRMPRMTLTPATASSAAPAGVCTTCFGLPRGLLTS